jgi:hypothetical protein
MRVRAGSDCGRVVRSHRDRGAAGVGRSRPPARASFAEGRRDHRAASRIAAGSSGPTGIAAPGGVALSVLSADLALLMSERHEPQREPKER